MKILCHIIILNLIIITSFTLVICFDREHLLSSGVRTAIDYDVVSPERIKFDGIIGQNNMIQENESDIVLYFVDSFLQLHIDIKWPLPFSLPSSIISTFGQTNDDIEFNLGIDISGFEEDPVKAVYYGLINRIENGEVIIEHRFRSPTWLHENIPCTKIWHTIYSNVDTDVKVGDEVYAGQEIGKLKFMPSSNYQPYLHFEVRIGSPCSLEEVLQNGCLSIGYDPHVHPLLLMKTIDGPEYDRPEINVINDIGPISDGVIEISTPMSQPNLNRFEVQIIGKDKQTKKNHIIDFNLRTSFSYFNTMDKLKPHFIPVKSASGEGLDNKMPLWKTRLVIPASWVGHKDRYDWFRLVVDDIWGKKTSFSFTSEQTSW